MNWHRLFGLGLEDFFAGSPFAVEFEIDLSAKRQLLDVVVVRKGTGAFVGCLPDGLTELANYNLITFKSHHEPLDDWAVKELIGYYVNYRKQASSPDGPLLPEHEFRLFAVCARFPQALAQRVQLHEAGPGVFDCGWGTDSVRIIVTSRLALANHNSLLHLFSARSELLQFAAENYRYAVATNEQYYLHAIRTLSVGGFGNAVHDGGIPTRFRA